MADDTTIKPEGPTKTTGPKVLGGPTKTEGPTELGGPMKFKEQTKAGGLTDLGGSTNKTQREELFRSKELTEPAWLSKLDERWYSMRLEPSTVSLENVLDQTRILHIMAKYNYEHLLKQGARITRSKDTEGEKSGHTMFKGESMRLRVKWKSLDDETHLMIDDRDLFPDHFLDFISILCLMCPVVRHVSISLLNFDPFPHMRYKGDPSTEGMKSVCTVCVEMNWGSLSDVLLAVSGYFPNAQSLDVQWDGRIVDSPYMISLSEVNHSSVLKKLTLTAHEIHGKSEVKYLFLVISNKCPNITSLVISGITSVQFKRSFPWKLPYLTDIQLDPGVGDFYPFETLSYVLNLTSVEIPQLELLEANKVSLQPGTNMPLVSVTWSRLSSGCELKLKDASVTVPLEDLIQLVSNELKCVTSLRLDRCNVMLPEKIDRPKQKLGEGSSLRELELFNMKRSLPDAYLQKLDEIFPDVKVKVFDESNVSHDVVGEQRPQPDPEDSQHGEEKTAMSERQTSSASLSLLDELGDAAARFQFHDDQKNTQGALQDQEERETGDEVTATPIKLECCKRVGVEGGKLQLETFGIELDIPPGAIDSESPQEISLRVLTDTPNLGNSEEEISVCFGVQCLAPDSMVLKLPVTFTIPHCAVTPKLYDVKAVLYFGEGQYTPDSVVKERILLTMSGAPSCIIMKDILKLRVNHFTWWFITIKKNDSVQGKRLCCQPMVCTRMPVERTPIIFHTHLYDDIKGNREYGLLRWIKGFIASEETWLEEELKEGFKKVHSETQILVETTGDDLKLKCSVNNETGQAKTLSYKKVCGLSHNCVPFQLDLTRHSDNVAVLLTVGQSEEDETELLCPVQFTPHQEKQQSQMERDVSMTITSPKQEDFDDMLTTVAKRVTKNTEIDCLGKKLCFDPTDIDLYRDANRKDSDVSYMGTLSMLRDWRKKQTAATERAALKLALEEASQCRLAAQLFEN